MTQPLATALGRLAAPPRGGAREPIRLALLDALVAARAADRLDGGAWLAAWTAAATALRDEVIAEARDRIAQAANHSRYPDDLLRDALPDDAAAGRLLQQILAEGMALEQLESLGESADADRRRGAALEAAWDAAVQLATREAGRYRAVADRVRDWRRPWRPLVIAGSAATLLTVVVAAMIGGVIPSPGWFEPVVDWFWGLPWP